MTTSKDFERLAKEREYLCLELQKNRRLVEGRLKNTAKDFPRSMTMRFLMNNKPVNSMPKGSVSKLAPFVSGGFFLIKWIYTASTKRRLYKQHAKNR
ncbi:MAG TPA: hypothetical protein VIQ03_07810 [Gammaproteobacteria bacterium]